MENLEKLKKYWNQLYSNNFDNLLTQFIAEIEDFNLNFQDNHIQNKLWYKDAVVYSLYVDLFNKDFHGLIEKITYLKELGVNCIWLLPILDSPMKDAGFDISDYRKIRSELVRHNENPNDVFEDFIRIANANNIKVIFDIAINHTSDQHAWFLKSCEPEKNHYSDYYIWSDTDSKYNSCRIIFKGMCHSNWERLGDRYYFHRFFEFQPDLNYRNPNVLVDMTRNFLFWMKKGISGFRADAIPYLWKEEGTDCENLDKTHIIIKFFRTVIDMINPSVLLLAEACQQPAEVVKYMGNGDECHAGYHFPLMPQIFKSIAIEDFSNIKEVLTEKTPEIPRNCQWFTFLRCHDELSLELVYVSEEDRKLIHDNYCHEPLWDFRKGEGISARLSELMKFDHKKILLAYSLMLSLPGTPVIYYGDEFAKRNDEDFYNLKRVHTGHDDTRFLVRGQIDWKKTEEKLSDKNSLEHRIYYNLTKMLQIRSKYKSFGHGTISYLNTENGFAIYSRRFAEEEIIVANNLTNKPINIKKFNNFDDYKSLIGIIEDNREFITIDSLSFVWFAKK